jgi:hypothetical protein
MGVRFYESTSATKPNVRYLTAIDGAKAYTVELLDLDAADETTYQKTIQWAERLTANHLRRIEANEQHDIREETL